MNKEQLLRYAFLKSEIKSMTKELDELKPTIVETMNELEKDELILPDVGKFYFKERRTWIYPMDITNMEAQLKADKKVAQQKGTATCDISRDLNFRGQNEQGNEEI